MKREIERSGSVLQREISQNRPFSSKSHEAVLGIMRTAGELKRRIADEVRSEGLTSQQYNVLRILRGSEPEGLPTLTIAERMIERTPGITGLIDRLERKGLVERRAMEGDRRCVVCRISLAGLESLERLDPVMKDYDQKNLGMLSKGEVETLVRLLDNVRSGL